MATGGPSVDLQIPNLTLRFCLLIAILCLAAFSKASEHPYERVYVNSDENLQSPIHCASTLSVSDPEKRYELLIKKNGCSKECRSAFSPFCKEDKEIRCQVAFHPKSEFMRRAMAICGDTRNASISGCRNEIGMGTYYSIFDCLRRPQGNKACSDFSKKTAVTYIGSNYCKFKGPYYVYFEPKYYQLTYKCSQSKTTRDVEGKMISYDSYIMRQRGNTLCKEYLGPPLDFTSGRVCFKFEYAYFSKSGPILRFQTYGISSWVLEFDARTNTRLNQWYCKALEGSAPKVLISITGKKLKHAVIVSYKFHEKAASSSNDEGNDDDKGLSPFYIALIVIVSFLGFGCCYCCIRCQMTNGCNDTPDEDFVDPDENDENEPFQENGTHSPSLNRPNPDFPIVHNTLRGTIPALNSQSSPHTSRSSSPHHTSLSLNAISSPVYPPDDQETSLHPSATFATSESVSAPPPSYESLFPQE